MDNIRKITHTLAHFLNLPLLILWCVDRLLSVAWYRKLQGYVAHKMVYDNYIILLLKLNKSVSHGVGDTYYLLNRSSNGAPPLQRSHPFTSFSNHGMSLRSEEVGVAEKTWDIGKSREKFYIIY